MKQNYLVLCLFLFLLSAKTNAQIVNQIYDHDSTNLTQLHNMPFDETRLMVVSGLDYTAEGRTFYELDQVSNVLIDMTFNDVDTIWSFPEFKDDKIFFEASINGMGRELVAYDGTFTHFFDFNSGPNSSNPEIIEFEGEIYIIAKDDSIRQLYKYIGGTSFQQISEETENNVEYFLANRGDDHYYTTFSPQNGRSIMYTENNNGTLTHTWVGSGSSQEILGNVVLLNGDIFMLYIAYTAFNTGYRVDKIDQSNIIYTHHYEIGNQLSFGRILAFDDELLFYISEANQSNVQNISTIGQPTVQISLDPALYYSIGNHIVQNDKLFLLGYNYVVDATGAVPIELIGDGSNINVNPTFLSDSSFYLMEITPISGDDSGLIEISSITNQAIRYPVSTEGGDMYINSPMVENNGELKFIFRTENTPSTDIYAFNSALNLNESTLSAFKMFPNPSINGSFSVVLPQSGELTIVSLEGQTIQSMDLNIGVNKVSIKDLSSGVYLVKYADMVQRLLVD